MAFDLSDSEKFVFRKFITGIRIAYCRALSEASPTVHGAKIVHPTIFVGRSRIELHECQIGYYPSPL